uniref:Copper-transporting ATPase PAA1 n=1 Tax=Cajanus cajan TaxID=3821 RepID=A0A151T291_CAJCA|nr:Putative copper-transporting ATPase PAA1 [Cajanus cajan]
MDSAFSVTTTAHMAFFRALHRHFAVAPQRAFLRRKLKCVVASYSNCSRTPCSFASAPSPSSLRSYGGLLLRTRCSLRCISSSAASFAGGGSGGGGIGDGGGGGGSGGESGDGNIKLVGDTAQELSSLSPDVIILDVSGMVCGGCAATVKRILESRPQVSSVSVNLTTETAIVWPVSEAKNAPNWQKQLGEALAEHLTSCGYNSSLRDSARDSFLQIFERKMEERHRQLRQCGRELAVSWALCAVCLVGHFSHFFAPKAPWIHAFHSIGFHLSLSLFTLLGPGRQLILDGLKSLLKRTPNMNTLVGLGALSSFTVSSLATLLPKLGWKAFFEEPIMLIAFVLLGRNLEQRAKIKATSDMTGLLSLLPPKARLLVNNGETEVGLVVEVPSDSISVGDQIIVLPGDRVPADGVVRAGRSTIDESSFTGEPLPVTKVTGSEVAAGSINLNGTLTVEVRRPGGETVMGDIVRLVEEAQSREAPVQRLADKHFMYIQVAGHFTYGVMAASAATFTFWSLYGKHILPSALYQGSPVSLALQLACSVLVVACPCALGLATPTAVLVGTSLGAKQGLLLRGGNILEKFAMVNTVVFDKTGTLTVGRPVVTNIVTPTCIKKAISSQTEENVLSDVEVLRLAAGVESNSVHPVGKAIVDAAQAFNCHNAKVTDGTFLEEPGSGAVATIDNKKVSVGTLEWITRNGVINSIHQEVEKYNNQSFVYVGVDDSLAGLIYFEDEIREDARDVVDTLSKQNIGVYMLSGDKKNVAEHVASLVGIPKEKVLSGVKPDEKKKFINELQKDKNIVAMVGDGINDAAALASSHIGIALGGGVGAASEVSSIVLMRNQLSQTHHQNGVVERKHRHIFELGLTLLAQANLPMQFWDHAFMTNVYLINRLPSSHPTLHQPPQMNIVQFPPIPHTSATSLNIPPESPNSQDITTYMSPSNLSIPTSSILESNNSPIINPHNVHPMITRAKYGIIKSHLQPTLLLTYVEPKTTKQALPNSTWFTAMQTEYNALLHNGTWSLVNLPQNRTTIGFKWVFRVKENPDGIVQKYKARLVAKGFHQQFGYDNNETLVDALELSRLTMNTVKQNLWWAFIYNIVGIPIAAGVLFPINGTVLTPSIAGALMGLSSVGVMTNSLLLRFKFSSKQKQIHSKLPKIKIHGGSDLAQQNQKTNHPY